MNNPLQVSLAGLCLKNPVMNASGAFGFGEHFRSFFDPSMMGAVVAKSVTPLPKAGNPPLRILETPSGMLNAIGLENPGLDEFLCEIAPKLKDIGTVVIVNVAGSTFEDYLKVATSIEQAGAADALEINISCPNVKEGGYAFGADARSASKLVGMLRSRLDLPMIVKLSPNVTDIGEIAVACEEAGADALSMINTLIGMGIDIKTGKPVLANVTGGLSGPAIKPVALRMVYQASMRVSIPIIGMGGITCWQDALEFMMAGACAVAIGTGQLCNPRCIPDTIEGLMRYCEAGGIQGIGSVVGKAHQRGE